MFSYTVSSGTRLNIWNTKPIERLRIRESLVSLRVLVSSPRNRRRPDVGWSRQPMRLRSVDLPEPDGPTTATNSPRWMARFTSCSAVTGAEELPYVLPTDVSSIMTVRPCASAFVGHVGEGAGD